MGCGDGGVHLHPSTYEFHHFVGTIYTVGYGSVYLYGILWVRGVGNGRVYLWCFDSVCVGNE